MNYPVPIDLLIFDLDGTLLDTLQDLTEAANFALNRMGRPPIDPDKAREYIGDGARAFLQRALKSDDSVLIQKTIDTFRDYYSEHIVDHTRLYEGMAPVLRHYKTAGKLLAVLSNKPDRFVKQSLDALELSTHFDLIVGARDDLPLKPDPGPIFEILDHFKVIPQRAAMIGDSENDVLAGQAAGVTTVAVSYGFRAEQLLKSHHPDFLIHEPEKLLTLFC